MKLCNQILFLICILYTNSQQVKILKSYINKFNNYLDHKKRCIKSYSKKI